MNAPDSRAATAGLLFGAVLISFSAVFVRLVSVPPTASAFYRVFIGGVVLAAWALLRRGRQREARPRSPRPRIVAVLLLSAVVFFALDLAFWHRSIVLVGPGLATLLGNFQVFFLALAGIFLYRERPEARTLIAMPMALGGIALIVGFEGFTASTDVRLGVAFGLFTALTYAGYLLSLRRIGELEKRRAGDGRNGAADLAVISLASAALLVPVVYASGETLAIGTVRDGVILVAYGLISQVIGWLIIARSLPGVPASRAGVILLLQPLLSFVWDVVLLGRPVSLREAAGAAIALAAIWLGTAVRKTG
ncbi:MAG: DMT family transporter [Pseudomonadota bacterium]